MTATPTATLMYGGRVVKGCLQSAVQEYRRPEGRRILMVGCVHMAEPGYYEDVLKIVQEAEASGATVYMEGASFREEDPKGTEEELRAVRASRDALGTQYTDLPSLLDIPWIYQGHSVLAPYPSTWLKSDAREIDMIRLVGPTNGTGLAPSAAKYEWFKHLKDAKGADSLAYKVARGKWAQTYIYHHKQWGRAHRLWSRVLLRIRRIAGGVARTFTRKPAPTGNGWMRPYIYTYRECVATLKALDTERDVVMLWHPGHMIGIGRILARNGFEPQEPRWLTACHKVEIDPGKKPEAKDSATTGR